MSRTKKLVRLSAEQEALLPVYRDKWLARGLCTEPADRQGAMVGIDEAYRQAGLAPPAIKIWLRSPFEGAIGTRLLNTIVMDPRERMARYQVWTQVMDRAWADSWSQVEAQVRGQVWDQLVHRVWGEAWNQAAKQVWSQVKEEVVTEVWNQVENQLINPVCTQVGNQVWHQVSDQVRNSLPLAGFGQFDAPELAYYDYFSAVCGLTGLESLRGLWRLAETCGWYWTFRDAVILTERPRRICRDTHGRVHADDGMAIEYPGGWGIYVWHGVRVPEKVILRPFDLTIAEIEQERNLEVRRVMLQQYGEERYFLESGGKKIHEDRYGTLYRKELADDEPLVMVRVVNSTPEPDGSGPRTYWLRVPSHVRTAHKAVAWSFGLPKKAYGPTYET